MNAEANYSETLKGFNSSLDKNMQEITFTQINSSSITVNTNNDCSVIFITTANLQESVSQQNSVNTENLEETSININEDDNKPLRGDSLKKLKKTYDFDQEINAYASRHEEIMADDDRSTIYSGIHQDEMEIQTENSYGYDRNSEICQAVELASSLGGTCITKPESSSRPSTFEFM